MSTFKPKVSLEVLPQDVMTLKDDQFYSLVEKLTSNDVARIFKCQSINSINTFLLCKNILEPILLPASAFDAIRRDVCVKLNQNQNNSYVIHVGIAGQIDYLTELFQKKHLQDTKNTPKHRSFAPSSMPNLSSLSTASSAIITTSTPSSIMTSSTSPSPSTPNIDYRSNIISSINKWIISQKKIIGWSTLQLVEGSDYVIQPSSSADIASIICQCNTRLTVRISTDNMFLLSNVFKHWKKSKKCNLLVSKLSTSSTPIPSLSSSSNDADIDDEDQNSSSPLSTQSNTQTTNKRTISSIRSTENSTPTKRRRYT